MSGSDEKHASKTTQGDTFERDKVTYEISELAVVAEGEERTTLFVWLLVLASSISGLLFGESKNAFLHSKR